MLKSDLLEKLKDMADDADVNETIQGIEGFAKPFDFKSLGLDDFKNVLENNEVAKSYYQSSLDSGIGKGVAKYKENFSKNELPKLVEDGIKAKSQDGKSPIEIQLEEERKARQALEQKIQMKDLGEKYSKVLVELGLPLELTNHVLGDGNEETINKNIEDFKNMFTNFSTTKVKEKLGDFSYKVKETDPINDGITLEKFKNMGYKQKLELRNTNEELYKELVKQE